MQRMREETLCLATLFCSGDHSPKSPAVPLASCCDTALYARHWIESLCEYLRMPSALAVQMMMFLSSLPDANRFPSLEYATQYSVFLCPFSECSRSPSAQSYTRTREPTAATSWVPSGLKAMS